MMNFIDSASYRFTNKIPIETYGAGVLYHLH